MLLGYVSTLLIIIGLFAIFSGIIGFFKFPDFYTKIHTASVIECFGVPMCLLGFALIQTNFLSFFKLIFAGLLIFLLNPVSTHALGKASLLMKIRAYYKDKNV